MISCIRYVRVRAPWESHCEWALSASTHNRLNLQTEFRLWKRTTQFKCAIRCGMEKKQREKQQRLRPMSNAICNTMYSPPPPPIIAGPSNSSWSSSCAKSARSMAPPPPQPLPSSEPDDGEFILSRWIPPIILWPPWPPSRIKSAIRAAIFMLPPLLCYQRR